MKRMAILLTMLVLTTPASANQGLQNYLKSLRLAIQGAELAMTCEGVYASGLTKKCTYKQQEDFKAACDIFWPYVDKYLERSGKNRRGSLRLLNEIKSRARRAGRVMIRNGDWKKACKNFTPLLKEAEEKY